MKKILSIIKSDQFLVFLTVLIFTCFCVFFMFWFSYSNPGNFNFIDYRFNNSIYHRSIDGVRTSKEAVNLRPVAVIIENHVESRPPSGIEYASVIYETIVESGITRFLALFDYNFDVEKIGPVRSARPFFVDLAEEWNAVIFHAGGSQQALNQLRESKIANINEISSDGIFFWRDNAHFMPHNLYTSSNLVKRALSSKEIVTAANFQPWLFKDDSPVDPEDRNLLIDGVMIDFSDPDYKVYYQYVPADNDYVRYVGDEVHKTDRGIVLKAKNIIIQYVDSRIIDSYGRISIELKGKGKAEIYLDGKKIDGCWENEGGRTIFYGNSGQEVRLNRGTTWIELAFND